MKRDILIAFAVTRLGLIAVALTAVLCLPSITGPEYRHISDNPLVDMWYRWDTGWYIGIALNGYGWQSGLATPEANFLPLYPLLVGLPFRPPLTWPNTTLAEVTMAGVLLSNVCLLGALFVFDALLGLDFEDRGLRRLAIWLFLVAPATVFFSGAYTESLFFLLSLLAVYYARRERWAVAGLAGFLAGLTRVVGWTLVLPLAWEAWNQRRGPASLWVRSLPVVAPVLGYGLYVGAVSLALGGPGTYFGLVSSVWQRGVGLPWQAFADFFNGQPISFWGWERSWLDLAFVVVFFALALLAFRLRPSYGLYATAAVVFPVLSGTLVSMPRYVAIAFPAYIVLARWANGHRWRTLALLALSELLALLVAARFVTWRWIA